MPEITTPWGEVGEVVFKRTYARKLNSTTESWEQTVDRVISACETQLKVGFSKEEEAFARTMLLQLKGCVAGRFLWQLGTRTVKDLGLASLQNCSFTVVNHPIRPFTWTMDMLMLGSGVGYNIQREYVYELPKVRRARVVRKDTKDADFIVPDSREGWVKLLEKVLKAHFFTGRGFSYSTICIRGKGSPIRGFGGVAAGAEELCWGIAEISRVLNERAGKKARPIDCLDIMNILGYVVVAGNVRRSAQIAIGDVDDFQYLNAKRWDLGDIPRWRSMSNNSVVCNDVKHLKEAFWQGYKGNGEPYGLINLKLAQEVGRVGETQYPDPKVCGFNPCAEQPLAPYETCCLAEIFLPNISSLAELKKVAETLYRINKHSLALRCHHSETQDIVHEQMRMGIGVTGYLQASSEQKSWLSKTYKHLRQFDKIYSKQHKWPESVKLTTVKPSGTLSLLAGVTPGAHPGYAQYYIRRIRMASNLPLLKTLKEANYPTEYVKNIDGTTDYNTTVVEFPCSFPSRTVFEKDVTAVQQLETVKELQSKWSDNAVSCTIYYSLEELPEIQAWLEKEYSTSVKSCSFLLRKDHGFSQAPLEAITKETYHEMIKGLKQIDLSSDDINIIDAELEGIDECEGGACPVK